MRLPDGSELERGRGNHVSVEFNLLYRVRTYPVLAVSLTFAHYSPISRSRRTCIRVVACDDIGT